MPLTKSAKKALRVSKRKRLINLRLLNNIRKTTKDLKKAIEKNEDVKNYLALAQKAIDKALKRGIIHRNKAARKKSQLARLIAAKQQAK